MGQVHLVVGIQMCLLLMAGILCTRNCKHMGKEFMVLIPPVDGSTNIVIVGAAEITLKPYGQMNIKKTNESPITTSYMVDKPAAARKGSNIRVLSIRATKPVNVYVQSSEGGAFTALRRPSYGMRHRGFVIATADPWPTCSTYIAVVAYVDDVAINGTVRGKNAEAVFEQTNKTLPNGEEFENERIKERGEAFVITSSKDLSGTFIQADKPVAVYAGVECGELGSRVISKAIQIPHIEQLNRSYFSVSIRHDRFENAKFKEITSNGERRDIGPEAGQTKISNKLWGLVVQTVHVKKNVVLQTIFNMNPKLNYSLVAFDGFKTTLLIVQEKCGDCDRSIQLDKVDISRSDSIVLMNTSTTLAFQTHVEPGLHFLQSSTAFRLYAYGFSQSSVYSYDAPCVCYNCTAKKLTPATENNTEVSVTRTSGMSSATTESDDSVVTTVSGMSSATTESDDSVLTTVSGMSSVTTESDKSVVTTVSGMSSVTTESDESVVTTATGMSSVTTKSDDSVVTTVSGMSSVTTKSDDSVVTTTSGMSSVTTEGDESVVTTATGMLSGTTVGDDSVVGTTSGMSSVTTEGDESVVSTTSGMSSVTTEGDESVVTAASGMSYVTTKSDDSVVTTTSGMSSVTTEGDDSVVTTATGMLSGTTESDDSVVTTTSGMSSVTTESDESVVTTASGMSSVTTKSDESVVTTVSGMSYVTTEGDDSVVTTATAMLSVTTESDDSVLTTTTGMSSLTTEGDESVVTTASGMSSVTTKSDDSVVTTATGMSSVTTESDDSVVTTASGMSSVTTESDESSVTTETDVSSVTTEADTASIVTDPVLLSVTSTRSTESTGKTQGGSPSRPTSAQDTTTPNVTPAGTNTPTLQIRRICPNRSCVYRRDSNTPGIKELKAHLTIDTRNVGARFRSKNSIQDDRLLSRALGYIGAFIIFSPVVMIVMFDMRKLFAALKGLDAIEG